MKKILFYLLIAFFIYFLLISVGKAETLNYTVVQQYYRFRSANGSNVSSLYTRDGLGNFSFQHNYRYPFRIGFYGSHHTIGMTESPYLIQNAPYIMTVTYYSNRWMSETNYGGYPYIRIGQDNTDLVNGTIDLINSKCEMVKNQDINGYTGTCVWSFKIINHNDLSDYFDFWMDFNSSTMGYMTYHVNTNTIMGIQSVYLADYTLELEKAIENADGISELHNSLNSLKQAQQEQTDKLDDIYNNETENGDGTCKGIICNLKKIVKSVIQLPGKIIDLIASILDPTPPDTDGLVDNAVGWLPPGPIDSILNLPVIMFNSISNNLSNECQPLEVTLPFVDKELKIPCMNSVYASIGNGLPAFMETIGVIASAFLLFRYFLHLYKWTDDLTSFRNRHPGNWGGV